ncbi:MAG TPA: DNA gyrase subunit A, partial [Trebonia sp.]|nr:DNA gyrase subunit A [Trebonia sp.]
GLDGVREAYQTGRGIFRTRATVKIEQLNARKTGIVVTELPYSIGPEKVVARIKDLVQAKKLVGISDLKDLTDRNRGLNLVIEVRAGFNPEAVLAELYRLTPMEETFGINNVALVDGQPRTLGLRELLTIYVDHRLDVTRRRSEFRRRKRQERLHLVDGILVALLNIDEVIAVIRTSDDSAEAKSRLQQVFDLSEIQAQYILDTPLRRLTRFDKLELEREQERLRAEIAELTEILENDETLRALVGGEMADLAKKFGTPRRTVLMEAGEAVAAAVPLEVGDDPCQVVLSATGLLARIPLANPNPGIERTAAPPRKSASSTPADIVAAAVATTARGSIGAVTSAGRMIRVSVIEIPPAPSGEAVSLGAGHPVDEFVPGLDEGETVLALAPLDVGESGAGVALGTASGVVKRVLPEYPANRDEFELITLKDGDRVVGAVHLAGDTALLETTDLVFIASDAQLLRFPASVVRPQGRQAGGMAGIRLSDGATAIWFGALGPAAGPSGPSGPPGEAVVVTVAGRSGALPGTGGASVKLTPFSEYPPKGRATGGVRCQRFLKGEDGLIQAWIGPPPVLAATESGVMVDLSDMQGRRDGSGTALTRQLKYLGPAYRTP